VNACLRDGQGGSPTAVLRETGLSDDQRRRVPGLIGTSHAVFVADETHSGTVRLRFFTATGELAACGHGTVAALAVLAEQTQRADYRITLRVSGREFTGRAIRGDRNVEATFDPGPIGLRAASADEMFSIPNAVGIDADPVTTTGCVATLGRPRLLIRVLDRSVLAALTPDFAQLRVATDRLGLLGCYVYCGPDHDGRFAARMFAPSIGVGEDIANANSTACLAAHLCASGTGEIAVDMGDALGRPATITASAQAGRSTPSVRVGGFATVEQPSRHIEVV
jgi:PhzF family phenazine biosynthesis protein